MLRVIGAILHWSFLKPHPPSMKPHLAEVLARYRAKPGLCGVTGPLSRCGISADFVTARWSQGSCQEDKARAKAVLKPLLVSQVLMPH